MTRKIKLSKQEHVLRRVVSGIVSAGICLFLGLYLLPKTSLDFTVAMPIAVGAGAIGAAIFYLTHWRHPAWFWGGQAAYAVVAVIGCWILATTFYLEPSALRTCEVCGYKTIKEPGQQCGICGAILSEKALAKSGYTRMEDLIIEEQMVFFAPAQPGGPIDFFDNTIDRRPYLKDSTWRPLVTAAEIAAMVAMADSLERANAK